MRILLVTLHENFPYALLNVLNPANEFCAIVTDEVEPAKNFCEKVGLNKNLIFQMYELKECIKNFYYDYAILFSDGRLTFGDFPDEMRNYGLPKNKFVHIAITNVTEHNPFILETGLRYFEEHSAEVEMFATGMSYTAFCLDTTKFKYKLFNFARASQDLYYDYQVAKRVLTPKTGGGAD